MINLSFEYLNKGTKENNLIEEDYFRIGLSFTAKDLRFFKRKYQQNNNIINNKIE